MSTKKSAAAKTVRVGIIGTGGMANVHASQFNKIKGCKVVAACDVDLDRAKVFAGKYGIPRIYGDAASLLAEAEVDAVSIVTPDAFHMTVALQCLAAGKHVLCEKPLALNAGDAKKMVVAAQKAGVINMVNFSYRDWPCIQGAATAIHRGDIGEIRHVEASYLQAWLVSKVWGDWRTTPAWLWRLSSRHGSKGVLGDVGVHIVDFATYPAGPIREVYCRLKAFPKAPGNRIGKYRLDANDSATLNVEFANGALGVIHTSRWVGGNANRLYLKIAGTKGTIEIDSDVSTDSYKVCRGKDLDAGLWKTVKCKAVPGNYQRFITAIQTNIPGQPDFARGLEVQRVLDACFKSDADNRPVRI
jgi:predicted dehydrogenase